jgi:hypothetical protein
MPAMPSISAARSPSATSRELTETDRTAAVAFFLALDHGGRFRRFGRIMSNSAVAAYGAQLNFTSTRVIGAFVGDALVGIAEISIDEAGSMPCEVVMAADRAWQSTAIGRNMGHEIGMVLLNAAIAGVHALRRTRLLLSFQHDDCLMRGLVNGLVGAPICRIADKELTLQVAVTGRVGPLPALLANAGEIAVVFVWNRPQVVKASVAHHCALSTGPINA